MIEKSTIQNFKECNVFLFKMLFFAMFLIVFFCHPVKAALVSESFNLHTNSSDYYGDISGSFIFNTSSNSISSVFISGTWEPFAADSAVYDQSKNEIDFSCVGTCQEGHFNPHDQYLYLYLSSLNSLSKLGTQQISALYIPPTVYGQQYDFTGSLKTSPVPLPASFWLLGFGLIGVVLVSRKKMYSTTVYRFLMMS